MTQTTIRFTLSELCRRCQVEDAFIADLVAYGVLEPATQAVEQAFGVAEARRVQVAKRLYRDLGVNIAGIALVLELLDELEGLRRR